MPEIQHEDIARFAQDRVNLPATDVQRHREQVNRLRDRLEAKVNADPDFGLVKMLHSGSVAKGTALSSVNDLDVAVYVRTATAPDTDPALIPWLANRLAEANPQMAPSQFEEQEHSVKVNFHGSGLNVDVVPVLYEGDPDNRGYLIRKSDGRRLMTSVSLHLDFIRSRKKLYGGDYAQLIRLTKWWKITNDIRFKSFMIELLWSSLTDRGLDISDYPAALEQFFDYIVTSNLEEQIAFADYEAIPSPNSSDIEFLDPVNPQNNVAAKYSDDDRNAIVLASQDALDALCEARFASTKERAVACWQKVLGQSFKG